MTRELHAARRSTWWRAARDWRFQHPLFVQRLLTLALDARQRDSALAIDYSKTAAAIVEALMEEEAVGGDLRFDAWRYHSMLLREAGRYVECRSALDMAEVAAPLTSDPELSQAVVLLLRALLAIEPDVWEPAEGAALLELAERVFAVRDPTRQNTVNTVRGMLALRSGDEEHAASIFAEILASTDPQDETNYADALRNLLWAEVQRGRWAVDIRNQLDVLEALDRQRGGDLNVLRDRWIRGLLDLRLGEHSEALAVLRETMRGFEAKGHTDTAVRVGIDAHARCSWAKSMERASSCAATWPLAQSVSNAASRRAGER